MTESPGPLRLPAGIRVLLKLLRPKHRKAIEGDLMEEYERFVLPRRGHRAARRWLWGHALRGSLVGLAHRVYDSVMSLRARDFNASSGSSWGGGGQVDQLWQDLKYASRRLVGSPGFTLVAVVSLGIGIGANTAIFSIVNAVMLRRPPMTDPASLVEIYTHQPGGMIEYLPGAWGDLEDLRRLDVFEGVTAWEMFFASTQLEMGSEPILGEIVTGDFFDLLGIPLFRGRAFLPEEDQVEERDAVTVLSHSYWTERYGADPAALGGTIRLNGRQYTIVGIASERFSGMIPGMRMDLWVPRMMAPHVDAFRGPDGRLQDRGATSSFFRGRLRPGVSVAQAQASLDGLQVELAERYPDDWGNTTFRVMPTLDVSIHPQADRALLPVSILLMVVVGMVLLMACTNLATFLLARGADRKKEVALRLALGAPRSRLVRQLLTETTLLASLGGLAGVGLAYWTVELVTRFQPPLMIPINVDLSLDRNVLLFAAAATLGTGLLFGLLPAMHSTKLEVASTLKDESAGTSGGRRGVTLRNALVSAQVALSLVLLVGSSLFLQSLIEAQAVDPGFHAPEAAIVSIETSSSGYTQAEAEVAIEELRRLAVLSPAIDEVAVADRLPLGGTVAVMGVTIPGNENPEDPTGEIPIDQTTVDAGFFQFFEIPILAGRGFEASDRSGSPNVVVISQAAAQRFWPDESATGRQIWRGETAYTVIGVTRDTKVRTLGEAPRPQIYFPLAQRFSPLLTIVAQGPGAAADVQRALHQVVRDFDPDLVIMSETTMAEHLGLMLFPPRMAAILLAIAGGLALLLAVIGLYGVVSYSVAQRTREMGIRISIGADRAAVIRMVVGGGLKLVLVGGAFGMLAALGLTQLASRFLFGVSSTDPATFLGVPLLLLAVALVAAYLPARRASLIDPTEALRRG